MISPTIRSKVRNNIKPLYRLCGEYSTNSPSPKTPYRPESLALNHRNSGRPTTSSVINGLLLNQQVSITDAELKQILNVPYIEFKLPLNPEGYLAYTALVGRPNSRGRHVGVYIFTHVATGQMYVGSSNMLGRRLNQYFDPRKDYLNKKHRGLLLPLIKKDGFSAFTLKVYVMPADLSTGFYFLFLEQYLLLDPKFTLNTQLIVNFRTSQGTSLFMYNADLTVLYHTSNSISALKKRDRNTP